MAYTLTLTHSERKAFDWVGGRYDHGDKLGNMLSLECTQLPEESEWSEPGDIVFTIPEHVAWAMCDIINGDDGLACFGSELVRKLRKFADKVV